MKYFLLEADPHIPQPQFKDWYKILPPKKLRQGDIPRISRLSVEMPKEVDFMDIISFPYFMLSKEFYQLVKIYDDGIKFRYAILKDCLNRRHRLYGIPLLEEVDCLAPESEFNMDHSVLKRAVLRRKAVKNRILFRIGVVKTQYIVASLELVESTFRREVLGLAIKELEII